MEQNLNANVPKVPVKKDKKDILDNEVRLARTYAYDISKGVKELIMKQRMA